MKVFEIVSPTHSVHKIKSTGQEFRQNMGVRDLTKFYGPNGEDAPAPKNSKLVKVLGHGAYATAVKVKGKNEVMKISRGTADVADDPWYQYVSRLASDDHIASNPWFPRVYKMKVYETTDKVFKYFYVAYMEELYPLTSLGDDELRHLIAKSVQPKLTSRIRAAIPMSTYDPMKKLETMDAQKLRDVLVDKVRSWKARDPQLKQALDFLMNFHKDTDITEWNIMVRRTPVGPQLVLADPLKD